MEYFNKAPFLVVSNNPYMRGILKFVLETLLHTDVTELESEEKALNYLRGLANQPSMIIYDYNPNAYLLEDFVVQLKKDSKDVRIVILIDKVRKEGQDILKDTSQILLMDEHGLPMTLIEEAKTVFANSPYLNESEFCRIELRFLSILDGINKSLFIKLGNEKYVKLFSEDDNTENLELEKYILKGVEYLYIERKTALWVIEQVQKQINIFLRSNNFRFVLRGTNESAEKRYEQKILRISEEVHIDAEFRDEIVGTVDRIRNLVDKHPSVQAFLKQIQTKREIYSFFTQKINVTSFIACSLARELEWSSRTTLDKLVYAATLCDITLAVRPQILQINGVAEFEKIQGQLGEFEQSLFLYHPKEASSLTKNYFNLAPPETDSIVYQHHELPDGSGFPHGLKAERIAPLSALFIVANDFAYYFLLEEEPSIEEYLLRAQAKFDYVNFRKVIKALDKIRTRTK